MGIAHKITEIRGSKSRRAFADELNITEGTLRNYENGLSLPNFDFLTYLCKTKGISPVWLFDDTAEMYSNSTLDLQGDNDAVYVPLVKAKLSAGGGSFETSDEIEEMISFKRDFIMQKGNPKDMVLMRVIGDSMEPEVFDDDIVLIDQSKTDIRPRDIYAVSFEDCIYLKRVDMLPRQIALKSTNPAYPPVILDISDNMDHLFKIVGRVLWMSRDYS